MSDFNMQEKFDFIVEKLVEQGRPALEDDRRKCVYRGANGTKCAVGWLIPDDKYDVEFDLAPASGISQNNDTCERIRDIVGVKRGSRECAFLTDMQKAHDTSMPGDSWIRDFCDSARRVGLCYGLDVSSTMQTN